MRPKFLKILMASLFLSALGQGVEEILLLYRTPTFPAWANSLPAGRYQLLTFELTSFIVFLISPVLLFVVFYQLGKKVDLKRNCKPIVANLFIGGLVGNSVPYFLLEAWLTGSRWAWPWTYGSSDTLSIVLTVLELLLVLVGFGLDVVFSGFFALTLAYFRQKEPTTPASDDS